MKIEDIREPVRTIVNEADGDGLVITEEYGDRQLAENIIDFLLEYDLLKVEAS